MRPRFSRPTLTLAAQRYNARTLAPVAVDVIGAFTVQYHDDPKARGAVQISAKYTDHRAVLDAGTTGTWSAYAPSLDAGREMAQRKYGGFV